MAIYVRPYSEVPFEIAYASSVNRYVADMASSINAIGSANLSISSVGQTQLEAGSVVIAKLDGEVRFFQEVFS